MAIALLAFVSAAISVGPPRLVHAWVDPATRPYLVFGGPGVDIGEAIAVAPDGAVLLSGRFTSATLSAGATTLTNSGSGTSDVVVMSLTPDGEVRWARSIGSTANDYSEHLDVDGAGNVYVAGQLNRSVSSGITVTVSSLTGVTDAVSRVVAVDAAAGFVARFSAQGALDWITTVDGSGDEAVFAVDAVDAADLVVLGGYSTSATTTVSASSGSPMLVSGTPGGNEDGFVTALDATGRPTWTTRLGGVGDDRVDGVVARSATGPFFVTGQIDGVVTVSATPAAAAIPVHAGGGGHDGIVLTLDGAGAPDTSRVWSQRFGGADDDEAVTAAYDGSRLRVAAVIGGPGAIGASTSYASSSALSPGADILLADFDGALGFTPSSINPTVVGAMGNSSPRSIAVTPDGGDVTVGFYDAPDLAGQRFAIVKRRADATVEWVRTIGDAGRSIGQGVAVDAAGNIYMTGRFAGGDVDPSPTASTSVTAPGGDAILLLRLDCRGDFGPPCAPASIPPPPPPLRTTALPSPIAITAPSAVDTAVALSQAFFSPGVDTVMLATARSSVDALAAGSAAAKGSAPVLLTEPDSVPSTTMAELRRLAPSRIVVVGGEAAISDAVMDTLASLGAVVERIGGADRYATSASLSRFVAPNGASTVYVAAADRDPDALIAAAGAANASAPLLLVRSDGVPDITRAELERLEPRAVVVLGGPLAVADPVIAAIGRILPAATVSRVAGVDRIGTAVALSGHVAPGVPVAFVTVASDPERGVTTPAAAAAQGGPLLLIRRECLPVEVHDELLRLRPTRIVAVGDTTRSVVALEVCTD